MKSKLVRDRIPEIIRSRGENAVAHKATEAEYEAALRDKLHEEVAEFLDGISIEEAADVTEVMAALCGLDFSLLDLVRKRKAEDRGAFREGIILRME